MNPQDMQKIDSGIVKNKYAFKKRFKKDHPLPYIIGSVILLAVSAAFIPSTMSKATNFLYKASYTFKKL